MRIKVITKAPSMEAYNAFIRAASKKGCIIDETQPEIIVAIGGDGTMLKAIKENKRYGVPFAGINSGTLGFLMEEVGDLDIYVESIMQGRYQKIAYHLYSVEIEDVKGQAVIRDFFVDMIVERIEMNLTEMEVYINGLSFNYYAGDGFIVATPIGSTAYGIWAGGSAIHPEINALEIVPINPNNSARNAPLTIPLVLPWETELEFIIQKPKVRSVRVACDGKEIHMTEKVRKVAVRKSNENVSIIKVGQYDYLQRIKKKIIEKENYRKL
jgi:NAD+ kinase